MGGDRVSGSFRPERAKPPAASARTRALKLLARREHSARELAYKLAARGYSDDEAAQAVESLAAAGWQSDARYVESLVRTRIAQGFGPLRVESELLEAGVGEALIRDSLIAAEVDWNEQAVAAQQRKFAALPRKPADWQKQYRYLQGRGFDSGHIYSALKGEPPE